MVCGCKKTFCKSKVCKCKKAQIFCTDECACGDDCQNQQNPQVNGQGEAGGDNLAEAVGHGFGQAEDNGSAEAGPAIKPTQRKHCKTNVGIWENILALSREENDLIQAMSGLCAPPPSELEDIERKKRAVVENMTELYEFLQQKAQLSKETLTAQEYEAFRKKLTPCNICHRKFNPQRVKAHQTICIRRSALFAQGRPRL